LRRSSFRLLAAALLAAQLAACSGGGSSFAPQQPRAGNAAKRAAATFTIHWTNASVPAAVRRKDTISPAAQSITVSINGTLSTVVNRSGQSSQSITLDAPVGNDQFLFNVYDLQNGTGHLLGTATVSQLIVDGAANQVSASIQAVCAQTNVGYTPNSDPSAWVTLGSAGRAQTVQSIVVAGQAKAMLIVEPQDADGDVIISNNGGVVNYTITGSASVLPVDGAHIQLTPLTGPRTTTPDTLTVSAPGCPSTNVGVQHSPAIYVQNTSSTVYVADWYGDSALVTGAMATGDVLVGYSTAFGDLIAYNSGTGNVYSDNLDFSVRAYLFGAFPQSIVAWANHFGGIVGMARLNTNEFLPYTASFGVITDCPTNVMVPEPFVSIAAGTIPADNSVFAATTGILYALNEGDGCPTIGPIAAVEPIVANLAVLYNPTGPGSLYSFNAAGVAVSDYVESLSSVASSNDGFTGFPAMGAVDTDAGYLYAMVNGRLEVSTNAGTSLNLPAAPLTFGTPAAMVVISSNE